MTLRPNNQKTKPEATQQHVPQTRKKGRNNMQPPLGVGFGSGAKLEG